MNLQKLSTLARYPLIAAALVWGHGLGTAPEAYAQTPTVDPALLPAQQRMLKRITNAQREAAAAAAAAARKAKQASAKTTSATAMSLITPQAAILNPGGIPDYMGGVVPNWANTPPLRKFVDTLPGLTAANANNLGNYIPVATVNSTLFPAKTVAGKGSFPASDYVHIGLVDYTQQMHSDLPPTHLRGYKDLAGGDGKAHYLGPLIIAKRDVPTRVRFDNLLGTGTAGNLLLPVDETSMGAGYGSNTLYDTLGQRTGGSTDKYTQNRTELHLHGGATPWISDGTPHQWFTPAGDGTVYKKGVEFNNVPDMTSNATVFPGGPSAGDGIGTYYYSNQHSARLMFYHDHAYGITRLNVYAGEAAGYLLYDDVETNLITTGILPNQGGGVYNYGIPLILQDKTFVPGPTALANEDPTWDTTKWGGYGDLWYPHVYMPNQDPSNLLGANPMGRWDYGPWFWPPLTTAAGLRHGSIVDPLDPTRQIPGTPNPSLVPEAFMDTAMVNGTAYPKLAVAPQTYRFRILNAANDRVLNLSLFQADPLQGLTEVKMVPAAPGTIGFPPAWPTDGRAGGVPDPATAGPSMIQIGTEGGFLPAPVVIPPQPIGFDYNRRNIVVLNILDKSLLLGPAERADVIIDFSAYAGKSLILYNDAPAPVPAFDSRYDYYTGDPDQTSTGGAATTPAGYGPNTRTFMRFDVAASTPAPAFNLTALQAAFASTATSQGAYAKAQEPPVVPQAGYNSAFNQTYTDTWSTIAANDLAYTATENGVAVTTPMQPKAIQELFELDYGRMNATLGVELPRTNFNIQTTIPLGYTDAATEQLTDGTTQIWKITHNGVDTHPVHFHLFNVQLINRVGWDGAVRMPDANELGWKDTVRMNPLEDAIVAFRPITQRLPFVVPNSSRTLDPTKPAGSIITVTDPLTGNPTTGPNVASNNQWEYVWHCHILGHEENDFMRPMAVTVATVVPSRPNPLVATASGPTSVKLVWGDTSTNENGFRIERRTGAGAFAALATVVPNTNTYTDYSVVTGTTYGYRVLAQNQKGDSAFSPTASVSAAVAVPATSVAITASATSPQPPGTAVTFTATGTGGTVAYYQYQFEISANPVTTYTVVQPYSLDNTWPLPTTQAAGSYTIRASIRTSGAVAFDQQATMIFTITGPGATSVQLTPNYPSPMDAWRGIVFTATGIGSTGYQYQFSVNSVVVQAYSATPTYALDPWTVPGVYQVNVDVRTNPASLVPDASAALSYTISANPAIPASGVTIVSNLPSPQNLGTPVTFTAAGQGSFGFKYRYWLANPSLPGGIILAQDWSTNPSWTMPGTTNGGTYTVWVEVKTSAAVYRDAVNSMTFVVVGAIPATGVTLVSSLPSPQSFGTPVTFTATGQGASGYQFRFWLANVNLPGGIVLVQDWSPTPTWILPGTTSSGTYTVWVEVRTSTAVYRDAVNGPNGFTFVVQ